MRPSSALAASALAALAFAAPAKLLAEDVEESPPDERAVLGLFTTLPIYWGEASDLSQLVDGTARPHWAREMLEQDYQLVPLDFLGGDADALADIDLLLMAQPRALSPAENVALDQWVNQGGKLLLLADPMLTGHSAFPIGDRRRPQDVVLLSPILTHWGIEFSYPEDQPAGEYLVGQGSLKFPVNQAGRLDFGTRANGLPPPCGLTTDMLEAQCSFGEGRVVIFADATMLEDGDRPVEARVSAFERLLDIAFVLPGPDDVVIPFPAHEPAAP